MKEIIRRLRRENLLCVDHHDSGLEVYFALKNDEVYRLFKCRSCSSDVFYGLDYDFRPESEVRNYIEPRLLKLGRNELELVNDAKVHDKDGKRIKNIESLIKDLFENETSDTRT